LFGFSCKIGSGQDLHSTKQALSHRDLHPLLDEIFNIVDPATVRTSRHSKGRIIKSPQQLKQIPLACCFVQSDAHALRCNATKMKAYNPLVANKNTNETLNHVTTGILVSFL
jgi:hypothetical protein